MRKIEVERMSYDMGSGAYHGVVVKAGFRGVERIVPPAGEKYAFDVDKWARRVEVYVSPAGRSVRVYVDGEEVRAGLTVGEKP